MVVYYTTISVDKSLSKRIGILAARMGKSKKEVIEIAISLLEREIERVRR